MIAAGQTPAAQQPAPLTDPLNRTSPQSSVLSFLNECHAKDYRRAMHYLDLSRIPPADRMTEGPQLAQQLEQILNTDAQFDVATLSHDPEGDHQDQLPPNREQLVTIQLGAKPVELELARAELRSGVPVWLVAPDSVKLIPELVAATSASPIERKLPAVLVNTKMLDTSLWRWLALFILATATALLSRLASRALLLAMTPLIKRLLHRDWHDLLLSLLGPVQLLLCAAVFGAGAHWIDPGAVVRLYIQRGLELLTMLGGVWLAAGILDLIMARLHAALDGTRYTVSRSALPLISRVLKIVILALGVIAVLSGWGYDTTTLVAGLGLGGVALALAAQKTIENLFGSVAVVSDRPVYVGDFCKFGDSLGTVEDIGLRSTRIRTVDRTLLTVPNGQFSSMTLENFSRRDKMLFHIILNLRRDTTPQQVRKLLDAIQGILKKPIIETGAIPVRFVGIGSYSLDVEVSAYILTQNGDEYLRLQQEILLEILDAVAAAGTALALPTQASVPFVTENAPATQPDASPNKASRS